VPATSALLRNPLVFYLLLDNLLLSCGLREHGVRGEQHSQFAN
jgi:hypothetical protein